MDGDFVMDKILELANQLAAAIAELPLEEKVEALNQARLALRDVSPFKFEPIDCVQWVESGQIIANDYNPNSVAKPEMKLLQHSVREYGFAMPVITAPLETGESLTTKRIQVTVDGFHRHKTGSQTKDLAQRMLGYLPVATIAGDASDLNHLMAATVAFNRARGEHSVELMSGLVQKMIELGRTDQEIAKHLGMEAEEVLRLKQMTGLAGLFKGQTYSKAWEAIT
jgi:ParB-like chromosome segregation protein Spo0J